MNKRSTLRTIIVAAVLLTCLGVFVVVRRAPDQIRSMQEDSLVGGTERSVRDRYGSPKHEFAGHYGMPPLEWTEKFSGEVKSAVFARPGGELYVTYENRNGTWIVITNSFLPTGSVY